MGEHFTLTRPVEAELTHAARVSTLGELTASIAHEVKQPLAAVVTYGEAGLRWLQCDIPDLAEATNAMQHMIANGRRASDVITRLDALARQTDPQRALMSIDEIIDDVVMLVQRELSLRQMTLRVDRDPSSPSIYGDRIQLQQALINLVMNGIQASEAMPQRPQELRIISGVRKEAGRKPSATIAVRDFGVGLNQDIATKVFDAFYTTSLAEREWVSGYVAPSSRLMEVQSPSCSRMGRASVLLSIFRSQRRSRYDGAYRTVPD